MDSFPPNESEQNMPDETVVDHQIAPEAPAESPPTPEPQAAPQPEPSVSELRQVALDLGYPEETLKQYPDDKQLAQTLYRIADEYGRAQPLVELGQKFAPYADKLDKFQEWLSSQEQPPEAPKEEGPQFDWPAPEYDDAWEHVREEDDPLGTIRQKREQFRKFQEQTLRKFARNPQELISKAVEPVLTQREQQIKEYVQQQVQEARQAWEQQQTASVEQQEEQAWLQQNAKEFYAVDAKGELVRGRDGHPVPTEYGQKAWESYQWARALKDSDNKPLSVKEATALAMLRVPKPNGKPEAPKGSPQQPQRFMDTVSEAERHPERRPMDESAPTGQYPDAEDAFYAAARQAANEIGERI